MPLHLRFFALHFVPYTSAAEMRYSLQSAPWSTTNRQPVTKTVAGLSGTPLRFSCLVLCDMYKSKGIVQLMHSDPLWLASLFLK